VLGQGTAGYQTSTPRPGWAEADPEDWWQATCTAVRAAAGPAPAEVAALAVAGQMHGVLLCTERAVVLRPAITWLDRRAEAEAEDYRRLPAQMLARLGNAPSPGMAGPILLWLSRHEPGAYRQARWMLQPKDWLRHRLTGMGPTVMGPTVMGPTVMGPTVMGPTVMGPTGKAATDPTDASGTLLFDQNRQEWATDVAEALGLRADFLAAIRPPAEIAGALLPAAAEQLGLRPAVPALPVATGAADTAASLVAARLVPQPPGLPPGPTGLLTLGTGGQLIVPGPALASPNPDTPFSDNPDPVEPGSTINLYRAVDGGTYRLAAAQNVGVALDWVRRTLGASWEELYGTAARPWRADTPVFLPYLAGERWDHRGSGGAWTGLTLAHQRADLLRAALEGVAFLLRTKLDDLRADCGVSPAAIQLAGGGSRHPAWRQLLADALGVPLYPGGDGWLTARGAALIAAAATGVGQDASTTARSVQNSEAVLPAGHLAESAYQRFKSAGSQQNTLRRCIVLCRERGAGPAGQAQARGLRPDGGDELPGGHRRGRRSAGRRRAGRRPHGHDGWRPPGRGSCTRGGSECAPESDLAAARGALTVARPLADAESPAIRARAGGIPAVRARADHTYAVSAAVPVVLVPLADAPAHTNAAAALYQHGIAADEPADLGLAVALGPMTAVSLPGERDVAARTVGAGERGVTGRQRRDRGGRIRRHGPHPAPADVQEHQLAGRGQAALAGHMVEHVHAFLVVAEQLGPVPQLRARRGAADEAQVAFRRVDAAAGLGLVVGSEADVVQERLGRLGERHEVIGVHHVAVVVDPLRRHSPAAGGQSRHPVKGSSVPNAGTSASSCRV